MIGQPPRFTLFPSTTLFRSGRCSVRESQGERAGLDVVLGRDSDYRERGRPRREPGLVRRWRGSAVAQPPRDRKSTRLNSSHANISYAVFCLKKKKNMI